MHASMPEQAYDPIGKSSGSVAQLEEELSRLERVIEQLGVRTISIRPPAYDHAEKMSVPEPAPRSALHEHAMRLGRLITSLENLTAELDL